MTQIKLFNLLKTMDEDLHNKLLYIKEVTRNSLSYTAVKFPTYTPHDCSHSESVETTIDI